MKTSKDPVNDVLRVSYPGQDPEHRRYITGYENFMADLPYLDPKDENLLAKVHLSRELMQNLGKELQNEMWVGEALPAPGKFKRRILALEPPEVIAVDGDRGEQVIAKTEILLALWSDGMKSPVHGHSAGYIHEELVMGKMRVHTYRMVSPTSNVVRPLCTKVYNEGTIASVYNAPNPSNHFKRQNLIHNFVSIGASATLHLLPENTRDGRDNQFMPEYFEDQYPLDVDSVTRLSSFEAMYLQKGDVIMVRSDNVPDYADHFIVITGHNVMKPWGLRPLEVSIMTSPNGISLLDLFDPISGLILLKLKPEAKAAFFEFHDIKEEEGEMIFCDEVVNP